MADSKVSALAAKTTLTGAEEVYINDAGTSKKATLTNALATGKEYFVLGGTLDYTVSDGGTTHWAPGSETGSSEIRRFTQIPIDCTLKKLHARVRINTGQTNDMPITVQKNQADTALVLTIPKNEGEADYSETQDVSFAEGDTFAVEIVNSGNTGSFTMNNIQALFEVSV